MVEGHTKYCYRRAQGSRNIPGAGGLSAVLGKRPKIGTLSSIAVEGSKSRRPANGG